MNIKSTFRKLGLKAKKHSPEICATVGIVGAVASTVLACKATLKLDDILGESKETIDKIHEVRDDETLANKYSPEDARKDLTIVYIQSSVKVARLYAPSIILGAASIACIIASNQILRKRNAVLLTAYATLDKSYKEYRNRVVEKYGTDIDNALFNNIKATKIEESVTDEETGKTKKSKSTKNVADPTVNDYVRYFDETCLNYDKNKDYNMMLLKAQQQLANDKLIADGFIFLSDVYDMLGIKRTKMSQQVGWIYNPKGNPNGDNFVDFGIQETVRETEDGEYEEAILLNFNVDGPILDRI